MDNGYITAGIRARTILRWRRSTKPNTMKAKGKIKEAIEYVRDTFPDVIMVLYGPDGRWRYMDANMDAPSFRGLNVDISILEDACSEVAFFPIVYIL